MSTEAEIAAAAKTPTVETTDSRGYKYVETSPAWKKACLDLPCFATLKWPDYDTKCIDDVIDGQPVVIQLWKGRCENFLGRADFPGGIGGEVGVYQRISGQRLTAPYHFLPALARALYDVAVELVHDQLWWPVTRLKATSSFELVNPNTNQPTGETCGCSSRASTSTSRTSGRTTQPGPPASECGRPSTASSTSGDRNASSGVPKPQCGWQIHTPHAILFASSRLWELQAGVVAGATRPQQRGKSRKASLVPT
jgi:hypothetical protein